MNTHKAMVSLYTQKDVYMVYAERFTALICCQTKKIKTSHFKNKLTVTSPSLVSCILKTEAKKIMSLSWRMKNNKKGTCIHTVTSSSVEGLKNSSDKTKLS
jgi:hypothetical protein